MIQLDIVQFENLCGLQCSLEEISNWFNCSEDDVREWCINTYGDDFEPVFEKKSIGGKISLRRAQFKLAEKNANMAMWLGKQYLGQTDKIESPESNEKNNLTSLREKLKLVK